MFHSRPGGRGARPDLQKVEKQKSTKVEKYKKAKTKNHLTTPSHKIQLPLGRLPTGNWKCEIIWKDGLILAPIFWVFEKVTESPKRSDIMLHHCNALNSV